MTDEQTPADATDAYAAPTPTNYGAAFLTLIVEADDAFLARLIAATLDPSGGVGMWTTGLAPDASDEPTHFISTGYVGGGWLRMVPVAEWEQDAEGAWIMVSRTDGDEFAVVAGCDAAGVEVDLGAVAELFADVDSTQQDPQTAVTRMGLVLCQPPEPETGA
jgi:hypothetical protein